MNIELLETSIQPDIHRFNAEVSGVGIQLEWQEAVLHEIRLGINSIQSQNNQIVQEANTILDAHKSPLDVMNKRITDNAS